MGPVALPGESVRFRDELRYGGHGRMAVLVHGAHRQHAARENRRPARLRAQPRQHPGRAEQHSLQVQKRTYAAPRSIFSAGTNAFRHECPPSPGTHFVASALCWAYKLGRCYVTGPAVLLSTKFCAKTQEAPVYQVHTRSRTVIPG